MTGETCSLAAEPAGAGAVAVATGAARARG